VVKIILYAVKELPPNMRISSVTGFLKGSKSSFVTDNKLNELETYSVLSDFSTKKLEKLIGILVKKDLLETRNVNPYPNMATVSLTEEGNRFIFNKDSLNLGLFENKHVDYLAGVDKELYEKLRALRYQISREKGFSAYMVCSNESLIEMAKKMPVNFKEMIKVKGIGKSFMENYGERFLKVIMEHKSNYTPPVDSIKEKISTEIQRKEERSAEIQGPFDFLDILLNDPSGTNRAHVAYLLGETRDPQYVDVLCEATKDKNVNVRRLAVAALGKIGDIRAEDVLIMLLDDPTSGGRAYAATALGKIKSEKALIPLEKLRNDTVSYVKEAVEDAISRIKSKK
jgi:hypothetical protein